MPKRLAFLMAGALALFLGACNITQAPGDSGEAKSKVTVSVAFPNRSASGQGLSPQGVPWSATQAIVTVFNNQNQVAATVTLTWSNPTATLLLANGSYTFEVSVRNSSNTEVAWKKESHEIQADTTLLFVPKAILGDAWLSQSVFGLSPGESANLRLWVVEPGVPSGYSDGSFPLEDYEVSYEVGTCTQTDCSDFTPTTAATIVSQQKTGVKIAANNVSQDTVIYVRAAVSGLGPRPNSNADPQPTTLVRYSQPITITTTPSSNVGVAMDFNPPYISINNTSPQYGAQVPVNQPVTFSGFAGDSETGIKKVVAYVNSEEVYSYTPSSSPTYSVYWNFSFTPATPGRYDVDIVAFDNAGNSYRYYTYVEAQQ
jgi:hypothetical protein